MVIFIPLLNEGTNCWRPVEAEKVGADTYRILGFKPEDEEGPVATGEVVRCKTYRFSSGSESLVAVTPVNDKSRFASGRTTSFNWSLATGHLPQVTSRESQVTTHVSPATGHLSLPTNHESRVTTHVLPQVAGHWALVAFHESGITSHEPRLTATVSPVTRHSSLATFLTSATIFCCKSLRRHYLYVY